MPYRVFISVDLPAPFSPTMAWMVPLRTTMSMSEFATTPGKRLVIPRSSTAGAAASIVGVASAVIGRARLLAGSSPALAAEKRREPGETLSRGPGLLTRTYSVSGTVIVPSMICVR